MSFLRTIESPGISLANARARFLLAYPEFETTRILDDMRATDYTRLDKSGQAGYAKSWDGDKAPLWDG